MENRTVNFHLTARCNMKCKFCFSGFEGYRTELTKDEITQLILLCAEYFDRINFAGGEPTIIEELSQYSKVARNQDFKVSMVTNGASLLNREDEWIDRLQYFDMIGLSVDSLIPVTNRSHGRCSNGKILDSYDYRKITAIIEKTKALIKINTVVSKLNYREDLSAFIQETDPYRWKVFQLLPVKGENDRNSNLYSSREEYDHFVRNHQKAGLYPVVEDENLMRGSYYMISPDGRFFDNSNGELRYSDPILEVSIIRALEQISVDQEKYERRGGDYFLG